MNLKRKHLTHTEEEIKVYTKLDRIAELAKQKPNEKFTSLIHLINKEMLIQCHNEINGNKATGVKSDRSHVVL